jgi:NADH-quinone oxidoreductase subunit J
MEQIFFLFVAVLAVGAALNVIIQKSPINSAFSLIGVMGCLAILYITLQAQLIGAIQIIVYAGAIMVLFVFVIMLLNIRVEESHLDRHKYLYYLAVPFGALLFFEVYYSVSRLRNIENIAGNPFVPPVGTSESIGYGLFTHYLLPFEATSILILMAIVGSVILARREKE